MKELGSDAALKEEVASRLAKKHSITPQLMRAITRIVHEVVGKKCTGEKPKTSTQPAVSSSKGKGKRRDMASSFDWTQCRSEVCCCIPPCPCPPPLCRAISS